MSFGETLDLDDLARLLQRDSRELLKATERGDIPGRRVGGAWRFARAEINQWLEKTIGGLSTGQLKHIERQHPDPEEPLLASLMPVAYVAVPLRAGTKPSVLRELVKLAEQSWQLYDPDAILEAVQAREELASTAQENGMAFVHPRRPMPSALGEAVVAFGRTLSALPFGGRRGAGTDLFFLVLARDDRTHLRILARLARLMLRPGFADAVREAEDAATTRAVMVDAEAELLSEDAA